ncbi:MAG TPA: hypothetical protein VIG77_14170 [Ktedonobacterales bacterium]|jgi:hypothetical protein
MLPASFVPFFAASMGAAGALIGLLFIAISIAPERTVGKTAAPERAALAGNAFTALSDVFFISLVALIPTEAFGPIVGMMGALAFVATLRLAYKLLHPGADGKRLTLTQIVRRMTLVLASLIIYGLQVWQSFEVPSGSTHNTGVFIFVSSLIVATYGIALARMWSLLGARKDSLFAWLNVLNDIEE